MPRNTHSAGYLGLGLGAATLIGTVSTAIRAFFALLSDPTYLVSLQWAAIHVQHHVATDADRLVIARLVACVFGVLGAFVVLFTVALLYAYFGRPYVVPSDSPPPSGSTAPDSQKGSNS